MKRPSASPSCTFVSPSPWLYLLTGELLTASLIASSGPP